jgi:hypothetical protein
MSLKFKFKPNLEDGELIAARVGTASAPLGTADIHKAVTYSTDHNVLIAADGGEISSVLVAVDTTVDGDGFKLGDIQQIEVGSRMYAQVATGAPTVVAGTTLVVAAAQAARGTAQSYPLIKTGTPTIYRWIVRSIHTGSGAAGSIVVIERV